MVFVLQVQTEDCSLLGKEILKHIEQYQLSMCELARQVGITQPGLRAIVLQGGNPKKANIDKLASIIKIAPRELYQLVYEDKLKNAGGSEFLVEIFYDLIETFQRYAATLSTDKVPSDYKLVDKAFQLVKSFKHS
jgi:predicted XRE-type DNA-binding protein